MKQAEWIDYLFASLPFVPYWKAAVKYLVSHSASLSLGLMGLLVSRTINGGGAVMRKPEWLDYAVAHPFTLPVWIWAFLYLFINLAPEGWLGAAVPLLFFVLWLRLWLQSLTLILESQSALTASDERKELLPCIQPSNI